MAANKMITIDLKGDKVLKAFLENLPVQTEREVRREIKRSAVAVKAEYRRQLKNHVVSGDLRDSIKAVSTDSWKSAEVGSDLKQAVFIEHGTRAHKITPKVARLLSFFWPKLGKQMYLRFVKRHPGTPAFNSLRTAWISVMHPTSKFVSRLKERLRKIK